jgi:acyl dehydratase
MRTRSHALSQLGGPTVYKNNYSTQNMRRIIAVISATRFLRPVACGDTLEIYALLLRRARDRAADLI